MSSRMTQRSRKMNSAGGFEEIEVPFACPYCFAPITMLIDPSVPAQSYVEDCEVCCRPIEVRYQCGPEGVEAFEAERME